MRLVLGIRTPAPHLAVSSAPLVNPLNAWGILGSLLAALLWLGPTPVQAASKPEKVTIQLKWKHQFQFAGYYAALHKGYFAAEGIDALLVEGGPHKDPIREVTAGKAAYGVGDSDLLVAKAQGLPVVVVAAIYQHSPYVLMTRAADGIKEPKDLVGKRVMVEFNQGEIQAKAMFLHEGIDPSSINFLPQSWNIRDLIDGRTDAMSGYFGVEPYQFELIGAPVTLIRPADHGLDFYGDCLFTTTEEARNHTDRVARVRRAVIKGWGYALEHQEEVGGWILSMPGVQARGIHQGNITAEAKALESLVHSELVPVGQMNEDRWQKTLAIYKELGILPSTMSLDGFLFDPTQWLSVQNRNRLLLAAGIIAGLIFLFLAWIFVLRRHVRQSSAALSESEARYKQLVETAPDAIFIEYQGRFDYLNPAAVNLFGIQSADELIGHSVLENIHEDDKPCIQKRLQEFQAHPANLYLSELRLERPDGKQVEVEVMTTPIPWNGGMGARVFLHDITERNAAWQAMAESEENYRQLVENAPDCIFVANGGVFRYVNPAGLQMFEVESANDLLGKPMLEFIHPDDRPMLVARGQHFRDTGVPMPTQELRVMGSRGHVTSVEVTTTKVRFQGEVAARVFMRDITVWKQTEAALKNSQGVLRGFFDGAPFQMGVTEFTEDEDVILLSINATAAATMGLDVRKAVGTLVSSLGLPGAHRGVWVDQYHQAQKTGQPVHFEMQVSMSERELHWAVTLTCIGKSPNGRSRFAYLVEDVTERREMARVLEEQESTLRAFYDGAPMLMGVTEVTPDGEMIGISVNEAMARSFGKKVSEIVGITARQAGMEPEEHAIWLGRYREAEAAGQPIHFVLGGQGREHNDWLSVTIAPLEKSGTGYPRFCFISEDINKQKQYEQALRQGEIEQRQLAERLTTAQAVGHVGSWETDLATMEVIWSEQTHQIFGTDPVTFKPNHSAFLTLIHPKDRDAVDLALQESLHQDVSRAIVHRILARDGRTKIVEERWQVFRDEKGLPARAVGTCQDITERKEAENRHEALHHISEAAQSTATLPDLFHQIHEIIGGLLPAPNFFVALYDERKDELSFPYFVDQQDSQPGLRKLNDGTLTGQVIRTGKALLLTRGTGVEGSRPSLPVVGTDSIDWVGVPLKSRSGTIGALVLQSYSGEVSYTNKDLALLEFVSGQVAVAIERKQAEQELRDQNDLYQMVQRATSDVIWVRDIAADTLEWSDTITATFGYPSSKVPSTRQWWIDAVHPEDRDQVLNGIEIIIKSGGVVWSDEYRFRQMDGSYTQVLDRGYVVRDDAGKAIKMVGAMSDLSLRLRAEEAQAANSAKSEFLATMTHELRTPMIGMLGMVEILSHSQLDPDQRSALGTIQSSARSLLGIIGGILDFSKIEAGKLELEPQVVSLRYILEEEFSSYSGAAFNKGLRMTSEIAPEIAEAHLADPVRFREILANFFTNALKFTHEGTVGLRAELLASDEVSQTLAIRVWDTGIGVSQENQKRLFQPFVQAESTTTRRFGGTGLGLTICLRLAQMMGGRITMESDEGKGTTMSFIAAFPLADPEALKSAAKAGAWEPMEPPGREAALAAGCLVLLVEDHPTNRIVLTRQVQLAGYQVDTAEDGLQALNAWKEHGYGLVLTDIHMPRMDGYQLAAAIRRAEELAGRTRIPILALTANALEGELDRCLASGMDDCIIKPVSIPGLDAKLRQWLPAAALLMTQLAPGSAAKPGSVTADAVVAPPIDLAFLASYSQGDRAVTLEILCDFRDTTRADVEGLRPAEDRGDLEHLARLAHRIKGASGMVGAKPLAEAAAILEAHASAGEGHLVFDALSGVESAYALVDSFTTLEIEKG